MKSFATNALRQRSAIAFFLPGGGGFPAPRPTLRRVRPIVADFCREHEITYNEVTIFRAWSIVATYLNRVGLAAGRDPFVCPVVASLRPL